MEEQKPKRTGPHLFQKGQSGNPSGRPKRKPLTTAVLAVWDKKPTRGSDGRTHEERTRDRLYDIIFYGDDKHSLAAIKLLWSYFEGQPAQDMQLQTDDALKSLAERIGAPYEWVKARHKEITERHLRIVDTSAIIEGEAKPVETPSGGRVRGVRRVIGP